MMARVETSLFATRYFFFIVCVIPSRGSRIRRGRTAQCMRVIFLPTDLSCVYSILVYAASLVRQPLLFLPNTSILVNSNASKLVMTQHATQFLD